MIHRPTQREVEAYGGRSASRRGFGLGMPRRRGLPPWTPKRLGSSLALWLRADLGVTLNGSTVSAWADQSGNSRTASQGTGGRQPTYVASVADLGGQPAFLYSAAAQTYLSTAAGAVVAQPTTLLAVARSGTLAANMIVLDGPVGGTRRQLAGINASNQHNAFAGATLNSSTTWANNAAHIVMVEFNGSSSAIYRNSATTTIASGNAGAVSFEGVAIGSANSGGQNWTGHIAEVIAVSGASANIRRALMQYASTRYAITVT